MITSTRINVLTLLALKLNKACSAFDWEIYWSKCSCDLSFKLSSGDNLSPPPI